MLKTRTRDAGTRNWERNAPSLDSPNWAETCLTAVSELTPIGVVGVDSDGTVIFVQGRALDALGLRPGESASMAFLNGRKHSLALMTDLRRALGGDERSSMLSAGDRRFETSCQPVRGRDGRVNGAVAIIRDVTDASRIEEERRRLAGEVRTGEDRLLALSRRLVELQEAERRHIARELHDEIGQALTGLQLTLEHGARLPVEDLKVNLGEAKELVAGLMEQVREMSLNLRPGMLDDLGLLPAVLWYLDRYTARTNVRVSFSHHGVEGRFRTEVETAAYRIIQEALTNVARHARTREATVRLWAGENALCLSVGDEGVGFDSRSRDTTASTGVAGMQERAQLLGGRFTVQSAVGAGAALLVRLPLSQEPLPNGV